MAVFLVALDRFFKSLAINNFSEEPISIINDLFSLTYAVNPNIAFSIPVSGTLLNILIIVILFSLVAHAKRLFKNNQTDTSLIISAIILGASSNLFDRLKYGFVIDYISVDYFSIFNLADVIIFFGVALILFRK